MAARALVDSHIEQGARLLQALDVAGIPVEAAYWMLSPEWDDWWLVLATPRGEETGTDRVSLQIIGVRRSLDDTDYLMGRLGVVGMDHRWVRAFRERLPNGVARPGTWIDGFFSRDGDLEVVDAYVYRFPPSAKRSKNGTARRHHAVRNGIAPGQKASGNGTPSTRRSRAASDA
jgi:hypothetical protein